MLRERAELSLRCLAEKSGVTSAMISLIERDKTSPSLVTLKKILTALDTDMAQFFSGDGDSQALPVFYRERMSVISDDERCYTMVLPHNKEIGIEILDEQLTVSDSKPSFEIVNCDIAGYVISGIMELEIKGEEPETLRAGDAFYIPQGQEHRGYAIEKTVRLITVVTPARY